jgi:hypothetical protein
MIVNNMMIPLLCYCTSNPGSWAGFAAKWDENKKVIVIIIIIIIQVFVFLCADSALPRKLWKGLETSK